MSARLVLVRHLPLDPELDEVCVGRTDADLPPASRARLPDLARELAALEPDRVVHCGLHRTRLLAEVIGHPRTTMDERLTERSFGRWEGRTWEAIYEAETTHAIKSFVNDPMGFVPPGGESVRRLRDRLRAWLRDQPTDGTTLAITHGAPIAALRGSLAELPFAEWPDLVPAKGAHVVMEGPFAT